MKITYTNTHAFHYGTRVSVCMTDYACLGYNFGYKFVKMLCMDK